MHIQILSITLFLAAAMPAADVSLRLGLTAMPKGNEFTVDATGPGGSGTSTDSGKWDSSGRMSLGVYIRDNKDDKPVAMYVGVGLAGTQMRLTDGTLKENQGEFGLFVEPGVSLKANDKFSVEVGIILGAGGSSYTEEDVGYKITASGGAYWEAGIVVRPVVTLDKVLLFAEVGYINNHVSYGESDVTGMPGVKICADISTSGGFFTIGAGMKLN